ncbi:NPFFR2 (predicted) [Pycnogonum litorale]
MYPERSERLIGHDFLQCTDKWPDERSKTIFFVVAHLMLCYLLPLVAITVCYVFIWIKVWRRRMPGEIASHQQADSVAQRSRIKVVKMILAVVVFFALSWLPLYITSAISYFGGPHQDVKIPSTIRPIAQWLGLSNSCINPLLYAYFNKKFREEFKLILMRKSSNSSSIFSPSMESKKRSLKLNIKMQAISFDGKAVDL